MTALRVVRALGLVTVQTPGGHPGWRGHGVPAGGALVPAWLVAANRAAGAPPDAAGLEYTGPLEVEAVRPLLVCAGGRRCALDAGQRLRLAGPSPAAVAYVAIGGGLVAPGLLARALGVGDVLVGAGAAGAPHDVALDALDATAALQVVPGPDREAFPDEALAALVTTTWTLAATGRAGARLEGPPLPRRDADTRRSAPVVRGAVQVPADGRPLVLGPDGPTIGGYPVLATLLAEDAAALAARAPGAKVRFAVAPRCAEVDARVQPGRGASPR